MSRILRPGFKSGRTKLIEALQKERELRKEADRRARRAEGELRRLRAILAPMEGLLPGPLRNWVKETTGR